MGGRGKSMDVATFQASAAAGAGGATDGQMDEDRGVEESGAVGSLDGDAAGAVADGVGHGGGEAGGRSSAQEEEEGYVLVDDPAGYPTTFDEVAAWLRGKGDYLEDRAREPADAGGESGEQVVGDDGGAPASEGAAGDVADAGTAGGEDLSFEAPDWLKDAGDGGGRWGAQVEPGSGREVPPVRDEDLTPWERDMIDGWKEWQDASRRGDEVGKREANEKYRAALSARDAANASGFEKAYKSARAMWDRRSPALKKAAKRALGSSSDAARRASAASRAADKPGASVGGVVLGSAFIAGERAASIKPAERGKTDRLFE